jgi:hypothetical protein
MARKSKSGAGKNLLQKITCPNCWHQFAPEESLFIAKHPELMGDPLAGANEPLRFAPTRFNLQGEALDPRGFSTSDLACPRCHLQFPESMLEVAPLFISIIGSPASGKSYFLTSMIWELRQLLPTLSLSFTDADPTKNSPIYDYEERIFRNQKPDAPTEISKTQRDDPRLYRTTIQAGVPVRYPVPLQFSLWPTPEHPRHRSADSMGRLIVMYDNAGEDFLPGAERGDSPVVQHLSRSNVMFMFFDPTQDPRFYELTQSHDPQLAGPLRPDQDVPSVGLRQETLLREVTVRVRRYLGLPQDHRRKKPLIVVLSKADIWADAIGGVIDEEPFAPGRGPWPLLMDVQKVDEVSNKIRELFVKYCPEFVATAEIFSSAVTYIPASALGTSPTVIERGDQRMYGVCPRDVKPKWATVPLLYCLAKYVTGMIGKVAAGDGD